MGWVDSDGDSLTYCWEQIDVSGKQSEIWPEYGPLFRSRPPTPYDKTRTFPIMSAVFSGPPTDILEIFEILPDRDRFMEFRLTVRDNHESGGGVVFDEMRIDVKGNPFKVTYPNGGEIFTAGDFITVTWDTGGGGTKASPLVDILLVSHTPAFTLIEDTENDGSVGLSVPYWFDSSTPDTSSQVRFMVRAASNVFFDVSDSNSTIKRDSTQTGVGGEPGLKLSLTVSPNPSFGSASVSFYVPDVGESSEHPVKIDIFDIQGRRIRVLYNGVLASGPQNLEWDGRNEHGVRTGHGVYFVRVEIDGGISVTRRLVRLE